MWDSVSWRQALSLFDTLQIAWEKHREQCIAKLRGTSGYVGLAESQRLEGMRADAERNIDTITASKIQMQEVLSGYRQSGDYASKSRVRSSLNAALQALPNWPQF